MVICTYEILIPQLLAADALPPAALTGAFEVAPAGDARLRLRDIQSAWPFEGRWHLRAQFAPPGEGHVFLDLLDPATPVPLLADGTASLRALPLGALAAGAPAGAPRAPAEWAWAAEDFAAWAGARRAAAAAAAAAVAAAEAGGGQPSPRAAEAEEQQAWREDGELREGGAAGRGIGAAAGEAAEAASAAAAAALNAAASAAANAMGAVSSFFGGRR
jgi:hypothetical protein